MIPNRQAGLPAPHNPANPAPFPTLHMGRVVAVHDDKPCVDVMLDDMTMLSEVPVMMAASGPDRASDDVPGVRSVVGVMYCWGSRMVPVVIGVFERADRALEGYEKGTYRRVWPNGTHMAVRESGLVELGFADGTSLVVGDQPDPQESHAGQDAESANGDPFSEVEPEAQEKPEPFQLTLKMADGSLLQFKDKSWRVELGENASVKAGKAITLEAGTEVTLKAGSNLKIDAAAEVSVKGGATVNVDAPLIKLNGGTMPIARVGDPVDTPMGPMTGVINVLVGGNKTVLA